VIISHAVIRHESGDRQIAMLSPLAVMPERQRSGVGKALVAAVLAIADERDEPLVVLEGSPAYYGPLGFEFARPHNIEIHLPDWAPPEAGQVMFLTAYDPADPTLRGQVIYPAAFDGL
jgi:putative acetyltransferase